MGASTDDVLVGETRGAVRVVRLNRPAARNALNTEMLTALDAEIARFGAHGVRAVIVTGTGERAFCAGADLRELAGLDSVGALRHLDLGQRVFARLDSCQIPVIAAVNGVALGGGCELVLACTMSVLVRGAELGLPETGLGLLPGYGGTQRLPGLVGSPTALHTMLTGARLSAERAYELGLTPVPPVEPAELLARAFEIADAIAARGPAATSAVLAATRAGNPRACAAGLLAETALAAGLAAGAEAAEGIAAFLEKRAPDFGAAARSDS